MDIWLEGPLSPEYQELEGLQFTMRFGSTANVLLKCKLKYYRISECNWTVMSQLYLAVKLVQKTGQKDKHVLLCTNLTEPPPLPHGDRAVWRIIPQPCRHVHQPQSSRAHG